MMLADEKGNALECSTIEAENAKILSVERIKILEKLSEKPAYPAELARALKMPIQTIYYHIDILERGGMLEFVDYEEHNGGIGKRYKNKSDSIALIINNNGWKKTQLQEKPVPKILQPFITAGYFDGLVVVGSPEPHGKYRARGSDLAALELAMFMGQYAAFDSPLYALDVRLNSDIRKKNLILTGGPKVNMFVEEINDNLPIKFDEKNFVVKSSMSKKEYEENVGVVEEVRNPYNSDSTILVVGGFNQHGTKAAILALIEKSHELGQGNSFNSSILARVVSGYDENGDGIVDSVEIIE